jgi:hypothetical protein
MQNHYAPRTIAFQSELFHPLVDADPQRLQRLHNEQFQGGSPLYTDFALLQNGALLSNPAARPGAVSSVSFTHDRMVLREELSHLTVDEFAQRVRTMAEAASAALGVQVFTAHQVTVRTLVNTRNFRDSRDYLKAGMFGFHGEEGEFAREPQLYGLRLVFPPSDREPNAHALRVESFHGDPRSLFLEDQATFSPLLVARGLESLEQHVHETYNFLVERALAFVGRFDVRAEA